MEIKPFIGHKDAQKDILTILQMPQAFLAPCEKSDGVVSHHGKSFVLFCLSSPPE